MSVLGTKRTYRVAPHMSCPLSGVKRTFLVHTFQLGQMRKCPIRMPTRQPETPAALRPTTFINSVAISPVDADDETPVLSLTIDRNSAIGLQIGRLQHSKQHAPIRRRSRWFRPLYRALEILARRTSSKLVSAQVALAALDTVKSVPTPSATFDLCQRAEGVNMQIIK